MNSKRIALFSGLLCHSLFLAAVSCMAYMLFWGMTRGILPLGGEWGRSVNILLLLQFPILHSFFLGRTGRSILVKLYPEELGMDLLTTTFTTLASIQLLAVFLFWTPYAAVWWRPRGAALAMMSSAYVLSWIYLLRALYDSGMAVQSGFLGWSSVYRQRKPKYPDLPTGGTYAWSRQPIYLGFALIVLSAPVWSFDHAVLAVVWCGYCFYGPRLKERRLLRRHGDRYRDYQQRVPYFFPRFR